jgi:hypothetical protein
MDAVPWELSGMPSCRSSREEARFRHATTDCADASFQFCNTGWVGKLSYNGQPFTIEDRTLAHVRVVVMNKLRRGEGFMLQVPSEHAAGKHSLWIGPAMPLSFQFYGGRSPGLDHGLVEEMMSEANGADGLDISRFLRELAR